MAGGRVVKGVNFVNLRDAGDPVEIAHRYDEQGADAITFLDITATSDGRETVLPEIIKACASKISIPIIVGGGIRTLEDIERMLDAGAKKVSINSAALANPDLITQASSRFGKQCIIVAIDAKEVSENQWQIFSHGGRKNTEIDAIEWARRAEELGAGEILPTSMDRDGVKTGYDLGLTRAIADAVDIPVIASGGAGNLQHLVDGIVEGHADAVLAAGIFHFGEYTIRQAKEYMREHGINVRL